jgi:hypothetical protein
MLRLFELVLPRPAPTFDDIAWRAPARSTVRSLAAAVVPIAIVVVTVGLRGALVTSRGLWEDEALRYFVTAGSPSPVRAMSAMHVAPVSWQADWDEVAGVAETLRMLRDDTPYLPAYYLLGNLTLHITGPRDFDILKLWNVVFTAMTVWIAWLWASRAGGTVAGVLAALAISVSAWDMGVSLQVKEYALAALCATGATWCLYRLLHVEPPRAAWYGYAAFVGLGVLTHLHIWLILLLHGLYAAGATRLRGPVWRRTASAAVLGASAAVPWLAYAGPNQLQHLRSASVAFGERYDGLGDALSRTVDLLRTMTWPVPSGTAHVVLPAGAVLLVLVGLVGRHRRAAALPAIVVAGFIAAALALFVADGGGQSLWPRYAAIVLPCAAVVVALGAAELVSRADRAATPHLAACAAIALLLVLGRFQVQAFRDARPPLDMYADWRPNAAQLARAVPDDALVVHAPGGADFLALMTYWSKPTRHMGWRGDGRVPAADWVAEAHGQPIWLILTWGTGQREADVLAAMAATGYRLRDTVTLDGGVATGWTP